MPLWISPACEVVGNNALLTGELLEVEEKNHLLRLRSGKFRFWCCFLHRFCVASVVLLANAMAPMVVRSSLEMMLDAIRQRDELPKDLPPALPVRPTSRGRLPTSRRLVPVELKFERSAPRRVENIKEEQTLRNNDLFLKGATFDGKSIEILEQMEESTRTRMPELVSYEEILQVPDVSDFSAVLSPLALVPVKKQSCDVTYSISQVTIAVHVINLVILITISSAHLTVELTTFFM